MDGSLENGVERAAGKRAILIAGPTASGKSALALALAKRLDGVIVNADSMQLYEDLRIVSARPSPDEEAQAPHRLYGVLPAAAAFSTGGWLRLAAEQISVIRAERRVPILVGGTGLYFKALTEGFAELPDIPETIRERARDLAEREGVEGLKQALRVEGDEAAAQDLSDPQRLARALEVILASGKPLSRWQKEQQSAPLLPSGSFSGLVLAPPRPWLHARIAERAQLMVRDEGIAEVEALLRKGLPASLPAMRAIGVAEIGRLLSGEWDRAEAAAKLTVATRQYAKRQETWFRNQMPLWQRLDPASELDSKQIVINM
ncbi:tRNA (adenosine(37)-N6)-dimethylallyltransferase MiaA [Rhodobacterales bacterium]|nr:tRNA (adenosine(37)-N6)-dimethylallyltransferase MiaA [Rhodobacterales bacterium]